MRTSNGPRPMCSRMIISGRVPGVSLLTGNIYVLCVVTMVPSVAAADQDWPQFV